MPQGPRQLKVVRKGMCLQASSLPLFLLTYRASLGPHASRGFHPVDLRSGRQGGEAVQISAAGTENQSCRSYSAHLKTIRAFGHIHL